MENERTEELFENMAQFIFERISSENLSEAEIKEIFIGTLGFTEAEYAKEIGDYSRPKD